ncbi:MAG: putative methyl-accepting chemotaxis protein [Candidatus Scalindua brodae]|uniref:Putative methyl-accepting chemotaxis protein n=1 Tax=Candidatus Scalindua brodae TaxID=237368 RepID=A0A0B0EII0_9BACT|nr:MAG: putative methyl-accepting chemotaxis protein [Candidatus Scalindua brodae]
MIVPFLSYNSYKLAIKDNYFNHLITTRDLLKLQIWNYFNARYGDIDVLSRNPVIAKGFTRLSGAFRAYGLENQQFQKIQSIYQPLMEYYVSAYGYANIFFVDKDGSVIYSELKEDFSGTDLFVGEFKEHRIASIFKISLEDVSFEDYYWNDKISDFTAYFGAPVFEAESLLGVIVIEIPFAHLDTILTQRAGLGQTGEMYLVGEDGFMRSNSRFSVTPTILQKEVNTEATRDAFEGYVGKKIIDDYRGVPVLSAYTPLNLNFINWALLVEIDEAEAFAQIHEVENKLIIIASIFIIIVGGYIYFIYRAHKKEEEQDIIKDPEEQEE